MGASRALMIQASDTRAGCALMIHASDIGAGCALMIQASDTGAGCAHRLHLWLLRLDCFAVVGDDNDPEGIGTIDLPVVTIIGLLRSRRG